MIELYKFGPMGKVCDPSPFCVKVEAYLKMAGLAYDTHSGNKYLRRAPKGKLPFIRDGDDVIADSMYIIRHLEDKHNGVLDGHLTPEQKAVAHSFIKMIDENLYWTMVYSRWAMDDNWMILKEAFFGSLPFPLKLFVPNMIRKNLLKTLQGQGIARHSAAEVTEIGDGDLAALSDYLGDKQYFFGDRPSSLDATAFGILSQMLLLDTFSAPVFDKARGYKNLVDFTHRVQDKYFGN